MVARAIESENYRKVVDGNIRDFIRTLDPKRDTELVGLDKFLEICDEVELAYNLRPLDSFEIPNIQKLVTPESEWPQARVVAKLCWALDMRSELCFDASKKS